MNYQTEELLRERYLRSQAVVGALLAEREAIMAALVDLVNVSRSCSLNILRLAGEPDARAAWLRAYALCDLWQKAMGPAQSEPAPQSTTQTVSG